MPLPDSLAGRLYLLGCRTDSDRPAGGMEAAARLRAAVLADLWLAGLLGGEPPRSADDPKGIVAVIGNPAHPDPVCAALLAEINRAGKRRNWAWWVGHGERATARAVEDHLAVTGAIELARTRWLGILPRTRVRLCDPTAVERLRATIRQAMVGTAPVAELDRGELVLAALAAAGELKLWQRGERRGARRRLDELYHAAGPVPAALRKVIRTRNSEYAAAGAAAVAGGACS